VAFLSEIESLKIIYKEIIEGYSVSDGYLIRHLDEIEHIEVSSHKLSLYVKYMKDGLPNAEAQTKTAIECGNWSAEKEGELVELPQTIADQETHFSSLIPAQQPQIRRVIQMLKEKRIALFIEKHALLSQTADAFADRESFNYLVYLSLYKSPKEKLFSSYQEFQELEDIQLMKYGQAMENMLAKINTVCMNRIASMPFFLNPLSYVKENVQFFLNKPVSQLTYYQSHIISLGLRNLNVLSNVNADPPTAMNAESFDALTLWYDQQYSILLGKRNSRQ